MRGEARDPSDRQLQGRAGGGSVCLSRLETGQYFLGQARFALETAWGRNRRVSIQPHTTRAGAAHDRRRQHADTQINIVGLDQSVAGEQLFGRFQAADPVRQAAERLVSRYGDGCKGREASTDPGGCVKDDVWADGALVRSHRRVWMFDVQLDEPARRDRDRGAAGRAQAEQGPRHRLDDHLGVARNRACAGQAIEIEPPARAGKFGLSDIVQAKCRSGDKATYSPSWRICQNSPVEGQVRSDFGTLGAATPAGRERRHGRTQSRYDHFDHGERSAIEALSFGSVFIVLSSAIRAKGERSRYSQELKLNSRWLTFEVVSVAPPGRWSDPEPVFSGLFRKGASSYLSPRRNSVGIAGRRT